MQIGYTNTATSPATGARSIVPEPLNFNADWRVKTETAGEVVLTNINASIDQPETIRISGTDIADIFKGSPIDAPVSTGSFSPSSKKGYSLLVQMSGVGLGSDDNRFPYSVHLVLKVPTGTEVTAANILQMIDRLTGCLFETKATDPSARLNALIRGALTPADL